MNFPALPASHRLVKTIDLQQDKRLSLRLNAASVILCAALISLMALFCPLELFPASADTVWEYAAPALLLVVLSAAYVLLHELVHGLFFHLYSKDRVRFGVHFLYAFAGMPNWYFDRRSYLVIGLSPVVLLGLALLLPLFFLQGSWFWIVYLIEVLNLSGSAGDLYVFYWMIRLPNDLLINDDGMNMRFYTRQD